MRGHEVDGESPDDTAPRQLLGDRVAVLGDRRGVVRCGGETAAEVGLAVWPAEQLVVGAEEFDAALGTGSQLDARATEPGSRDAFLDDPALALQLPEEPVGIEAVVLGSQSTDAPLDLGTVLGAAQIDEGVAEPAEASSSLTIASSGRPSGRIASTASATSATLRIPTAPRGCAIPAAANTSRLPVFVPR